jgi:hypothetical protein
LLDIFLSLFPTLRFDFLLSLQYDPILPGPTQVQ